jgi:hypothetical protein
MKLLHNNEVELSRALLASLPEGVDVIEGDGGYAVSAYPSVVIDVPAYTEQRPSYDADGNLVGMAPALVEAHEEVLRSPVSWDAVNSFKAYMDERARLNPVA